MLTDDEPTKTTPIRIPPDLRKRLEVQRERDKRGVELEILVLLEEAISFREAARKRYLERSK